MLPKRKKKVYPKKYEHHYALLQLKMVVKYLDAKRQPT